MLELSLKPEVSQTKILIEVDDGKSTAESSFEKSQESDPQVEVEESPEIKKNDRCHKKKPTRELKRCKKYCDKCEGICIFKGGLKDILREGKAQEIMFRCEHELILFEKLFSKYNFKEEGEQSQDHFYSKEFNDSLLKNLKWFSSMKLDDKVAILEEHEKANFTHKLPKKTKRTKCDLPLQTKFIE